MARENDYVASGLAAWRLDGKKKKKKRGTVEHMSQNEPTEKHRSNSFIWRIHFGTGEVGCANEQIRFKNKYFRGERIVEIPN